MAGLRFNRALARPWLPGHAAKVLLLAAAAACAPATAWALSAGRGGMLVAVCAAALAIVAIGLLLRPAERAAHALAEALAGGGVPDLPGDIADSSGRLLRDVRTAAARLDQQAERLAQRHGVTGLPTREPLLIEMATDLARPGCTGLLGAIRFADHDRLRAFDQMAAEAALRVIAARLTGALGRTRVLAQVDRDAFAIWFRGIDADAAAIELDAIVYVLTQEMHVDTLRLVPDIELGAVRVEEDDADGATLLTRALVALARPGAAGRGARILAPDGAAARERFAMEQDLRRAVAEDQLELHYQPVVDLARGRLAGAEALVRWRHPARGYVSPEQFVPILEASGLADEIGLWILNTAVREARGWQDAGHHGLKVAVNLSARQLRDPALQAMILRTLERHGLPPARLELELTETAALGDAARTAALFEALRRTGVSVAIDDFGSGYSSLSYVKNLPFDKLKIDREFVREVDVRSDSRAICTALIELARGLDIAVLAEGVETAAEVETLTALGCTLFQGFHFARPLPAADFAAILADPNWVQRLHLSPHIVAPKERLSA